MTLAPKAAVVAGFRRTTRDGPGSTDRPGRPDAMVKNLLICVCFSAYRHSPERAFMPETQAGTRIRPLDELDISAIVRIDERIGGIYRPDIWEQRVGFYLRRDPGASQVAEADGKVVGFML